MSSRQGDERHAFDVVSHRWRGGTTQAALNRPVQRPRQNLQRPRQLITRRDPHGDPIKPPYTLFEVQQGQWKSLRTAGECLRGRFCESNSVRTYCFRSAGTLGSFWVGNVDDPIPRDQLGTRSPDRNVKTCTPFRVTATVCSNCADSCPSRVTTVQPSSSVRTECRP